eukprot:gene26590-36250_t
MKDQAVDHESRVRVCPRRRDRTLLDIAELGKGKDLSAGLCGAAGSGAGAADAAAAEEESDAEQRQVERSVSSTQSLKSPQRRTDDAAAHSSKAPPKAAPKAGGAAERPAAPAADADGAAAGGGNADEPLHVVCHICSNARMPYADWKVHRTGRKHVRAAAGLKRDVEEVNKEVERTAREQLSSQEPRPPCRVAGQGTRWPEPQAA